MLTLSGQLPAGTTPRKWLQAVPELLLGAILSAGHGAQAAPVLWPKQKRKAGAQQCWTDILLHPPGDHRQVTQLPGASMPLSTKWGQTFLVGVV